DVPSHGSFADLAAPLPRKLERVREQIENDLLPHVPIDIDRLGKRWAAHAKLETGLLAGRTEVADKLRGQGREVGRLIGCLHSTTFDSNLRTSFSPMSRPT